jgi:hypothetical protein
MPAVLSCNIWYRPGAGKAGKEWKIDWSPRGYSPLRLPAGTIVTFKYRPGAGAALHLLLCTLLKTATSSTAASLCAHVLQNKKNSITPNSPPRHYAGIGYGSGKCSYKATFDRNSRKGGSLSVKIPKGSPNGHKLALCGPQSVTSVRFPAVQPLSSR